MGKIVFENFNEDDGYYNVNLAYLSKEQFEEIEAIVSKWSPTDEDIKDCIRMCLTDANEQRFKDYGTTFEECLTWLEKQIPKNKTALDKAIEDEVNAWIEKQNPIKFNDEEDERIRKAIICGMNALKDQKRETFATVPIDDCINWLEKQSEQKPIDEAKSKFKIGDWITFYGSKPFKILKVESEQNGILDYLLLSQNGHNSYYNKKYIDENARLWTIQDAKDGDVLFDGNNILLFQKVNHWNNITSYLAYSQVYGIREYFISGSDVISPATKEQRNLLFSKMHEAGYEWNEEKKDIT